MMVTLIMVWCLSTACEEVRDHVRLDMGACMIFGQHRAADWQRENPAYAEHQLRAWRCQMGERA